MQNNQLPIESLVELVDKSSIYQHIVQVTIVNSSKPEHYTIVDSKYSDFFFYKLIWRIVVFDFLCVIGFFCKLCHIVVV